MSLTDVELTQITQPSLPKSSALKLDPPEPHPENPEEKSSIFGLILFWFMDGVFRTGMKKQLDHEDLVPLRSTAFAEDLAVKFEKDWNERVAAGRPVSVTRVLFSSAWRTFLPAFLLMLLAGLVPFAGPIVLEQMVLFLQDPSSPWWWGIILAAILLVSSLIQSICGGQANRLMFNLAVQVNGSLLSTIYRHALWITPAGRAKRSTGGIVNLMSADVFLVFMILPILLYVLLAPIQVGISLYMLYRLIGIWPTLAGIGVMILLAPSQTLLTNRFRSLSRRKLKFADSRMKLISDVIAGIRLVKYYAWESSFLSRIQDIRVDEIKIMREWYLTGAGLSLAVGFIPAFVALAAFGTWSALGNAMTAQHIFGSLAVFELLRMPLHLLPMMLAFILMMNVSATRITKFLKIPRRESQLSELGIVSSDLPVDDPNRPVLRPYSEIGEGEPVATIRDGEFWYRLPLTPEEIKEKEKEKKQAARGGGGHGHGGGPISQKEEEDDVPARAILTDINMTVAKGELVMVVGPVGSGKSTVLMALLDEITRRKGQVAVNGQIAFAAQKSWIINATLKENVTMAGGSAVNEDRYQAAIAACAMGSDLEQLPNGDQTEIGERGITISGGQKARISLARALYADADVYLLDDVLAAVDAHVGRHIFDQVITGALKGKTRVVVTNQLQYLNQADRIYVMAEGTIAEQGTYPDLLAAGKSFSALLAEHSHDDQESPEVVKAETKTAKAKKPLNEEGDTDELVTEEERASGAVSHSTYLDYAKMWGPKWEVALMLIATIIAGGSKFLGNLWLAVWSDSLAGDLHEMGYLSLYAAALVAGLVIVALREVWWAFGSSRTMTRAHLQLTQSVVNSPVVFFDKTPQGRILNRFSRDFVEMEQQLPNQLNQLLNMTALLIAMLIIVAVLTRWTIIAFVPALVAFYFMQDFYRHSSRELQRLDLSARSPIYAHFTETLDGSASIHAFRLEQEMIARNVKKVDVNNTAFYNVRMAGRWFELRTSLLASIVTFAAAVTLTFLRGEITVGMGAVALTLMLFLSGTMGYYVMLMAETETRFTAVERILSWTNLPSEASTSKQVIPVDVPKDWPSEGVVEFRDVQLQYRPDLPLALSGISFRTNIHEKVGVIGRTGAGKSSLLVALYRMTEPCAGQILIDGIDLAAVPLDVLRGRLAMIPQDPVLFEGSLRFNLDPFDTKEDDEIWEALELVTLKPVVEGLNGKLKFEVTEGGSNFSVGQRQLIAFARALLRRARVVVLDEATASVDVETDTIVQKMVRSVFADCTVITVAHRLNTVMDNDRILVMDKGKAAEMDKPATLLADPKSILSSMVAETGDGNAQHLRKLAGAGALVSL